MEIARHHEKNYETGHECCFLADIIKSLNVGAPTISHHLKELSNSGLIITERKGKFLTARINKEVTCKIAKLLPF